MKKKRAFPQEFLIYICDYDGGKPLYAAASRLSDVPEDISGNLIGRYIHDSTSTFTVHRKLSDVQRRG